MVLYMIALQLELGLVVQSIAIPISAIVGTVTVSGTVLEVAATDAVTPATSSVLNIAQINVSPVRLVF